jgi:signal transduction histidine kinase
MEPMSTDQTDQLQDVSPSVPEIDLGDSLNSLTDLVLRLIDADACGIAKIQPDGGPPLMCTDRNAPSDFETTVNRLHETGAVEQAFESGRSVAVPGESEPGSGLVVAPLTAKEERLGVLVIRCRRPAGDIDASEIDLIETLARQAEIAFDNAILYQNLLATHQKLKSSQAQLVQSGKMAAVGQLAAGVAHEVNNPLQIILSRVQLLMMRHRELEPLVKDLHLIESNVKRISRIIRSLLDFARHNTGDEEWRRIDLVYLITQTVNLMQHLMEKAGIEVEVSHPSGGPPTIHGNVGEVEQIFLNLLINARQAMPDGGRIDITIRVEEETAIVRVSDTGEGIPEGYLEHIFDPFFTTREEVGGTGLGLSIIYGIIEKHNGRIEVESNEGLGTSFELQLPIEPS